MKSLSRILPLLLLCNGLYAQTQHLVTVAELKQLANCIDQACLASEVIPWDFIYKATKKGKSNGLEGTHYQYTRPHRNRAFTESTASYWVMSDNSRRVTLTSDNKSWIAGLKTDIEQNGFKFVDQKGAYSDEHYMLDEGGLVWHLNWKKPSLLVDLEPHTLTVYKEATSAIPSGNIVASGPGPATSKPTSAEPPHLGGDWDAKYPQQNVADLFKAERQYAAEQDRKRGKVGNNFSRCEKVRIQATYTGQYRPLTDDHWSKAFDIPLRHTGLGGFADRRVDLYRQEALFGVAGEAVWMPVQEPLIRSFQKESVVGQSVTLYAVLVSHHDYGGTLHLSFLVNEFAAGKNVVSTSSPASETTANYANPELVKSEATVAKCGFNWTPWSAVSTTEKAAMKKVMITFNAFSFQSLPAYIEKLIASGINVQIARHTFDKLPCYLIYEEYKNDIAGAKGQIRGVEGFGQSYLIGGSETDLCAVWPSDDGKGIVNEQNYSYHFMVNARYNNEYANFLKATNQLPANSTLRAINNSNRLGAKTPEELAILLLKCLKTNDKSTWMRCMHPDDSVETDEVSSRKFDRHRESMASDGVTNWALVQYSRLTYPLRPTGGDKVDPTKTIPHSTLEFTYKNQEFVGQLKIGTFSFYEGRWLIWFSGYPEDCQIYRNFGR